jgi:hypothetical protein
VKKRSYSRKIKNANSSTEEINVTDPVSARVTVLK